MFNGLNKAMFIGFLGRDAEVCYTSGGTAVANVSLAVTETWTDRTSGEKKQNTEWLRLVSWNRLAEIFGEHAKQGRMVYVEAKVKTRKYTKDNVAHWITEMNVRDFKILDWTTTAQRREQQNKQDLPLGYDNRTNEIPPIEEDDIPF